MTNKIQGKNNKIFEEEKKIKGFGGQGSGEVEGKLDDEVARINYS